MPTPKSHLNTGRRESINDYNCLCCDNLFIIRLEVWKCNLITKRNLQSKVTILSNKYLWFHGRYGHDPFRNRFVAIFLKQKFFKEEKSWKTLTFGNFSLTLKAMWIVAWASKPTNNLQVKGEIGKYVVHIWSNHDHYLAYLLVEFSENRSVKRQHFMRFLLCYLVTW